MSDSFDDEDINVIRVKRCCCLEVEIAKDEEVKDCCKEPYCLCGQYADHPLLNNAVCMKLRTSSGSVIILAFLLGFVFGNLLTFARPEKPNDRFCQDMNRLTALTATEDCSNFGSRKDNYTFSLAEKAILENKLAFCLDANCTKKYNIVDHESDKKLCYGQSGKINIVSIDDTPDCDKLKLISGMKKKDIFHVHMNMTKKTMGKYICLKILILVGTSEVYYSDTPCDVDMDIQFESFIEDEASSKAVHDQYSHELYVYKYSINYIFGFFGKLWINSLKLIILPLLVSSIIVTLSDMTEFDKAASLGFHTFLYYVSTTLLAAVESVIINTMILLPSLERFVSVDANSVNVNRATDTRADQIMGLFNSIVPSNILSACVGRVNYIGIIFFCMIVGMALPRKDHNGMPSVFYTWFSELSAMMFKILNVIIAFTPLGVFLFVVDTYAVRDVTQVLTQTSLFLTAVFVGLGIHLFFTLPMLYWVLTGMRKNPFAYMYNCLDAMLVALAVSSSIATLPTTLKCAKKNRIQENIADFCLYIGATVNMDGTTLGFPCAAIFVAYGEGMVLTFSDMILIVLTSTISSMAASPIPQSGLVLLMIILDNLGIPTNNVFFLVVAVDWLYDRPETMVNIVGDSFAAGIMNHYYGKKIGKKPLEHKGDL